MMLVTSLWTLKITVIWRVPRMKKTMILAILSPIEKANTDTDMDSDASDDMNDPLLHHFSKAITKFNM